MDQYDIQEVDLYIIHIQCLIRKKKTKGKNKKNKELEENLNLKINRVWGDLPINQKSKELEQNLKNKSRMGRFPHKNKIYTIIKVI